MSKGLGKTERACLISIGRRTRATTFAITADVYDVAPDGDGNRMINDAQHTAAKRALAGLRRKGLVKGEQQWSEGRDGSRILAFVRGAGDHRAERCCIWTLVDAAEAPGVEHEHVVEE